MVAASVVMLMLSVVLLNAWGFADTGTIKSLQVAGSKSSKPAYMIGITSPSGSVMANMGWRKRRYS